MPDSLQHQIALSLVPQVGAITAKTLVSYCGSAEAVFRASKRDLLKIPGIGAIVADQIRASAPLHLAERELDFLDLHHVTALFYTDERYPARLRQCYDCPAMLFFRGSSVDLLGAPRIVGIVGTRQPTDYGKALCEEFVDGLLQYNVLIVSGLAYGIDITAHRKASAIGIPNVGVLGHGLGSIYPNQHHSAALRMMENGGLLTEYVSNTRPDREHFPMRNRIIAGLADALLVVETAASGGSMITAELTKQYGRDLFAVPGRVRDPKSAGCNLLIKNDSAHLVESPQDLALTMGWGDTGPHKRPQQAQLFLELSPQEAQLIDIVRAQPEIPIDALSRALPIPAGELAGLILNLEFKGLLKTLPGKRYVVSG